MFLTPDDSYWKLITFNRRNVFLFACLNIKDSKNIGYFSLVYICWLSHVSLTLLSIYYNNGRRLYAIQILLELLSTGSIPVIAMLLL
jgi:hypothetical protein